MSPSPPSKKELRILTPIGMVGYGFSKELFWAAIEEGVDAVILDSGSTDSGPSKLALGGTTVTREGYERDLGTLVAACHSHQVPILIGSCGGDGADAHVDLFVEIVREIVAKNSYRTLKVISIYSEIPKDYVHEKLNNKSIIPCGKAVPELLPHDINTATRIVAQMGHEPYLQAMNDYPDFDIILGGRAYDPAPYAAFCIYHGFTNLGIAYHMGKIMECGALCALPKAKEALAIVRQDHFDIVPLDPTSQCTVVSVAAHTLYEKTRPDILHGPGGALLLTDATYEQLSDDRTVRVRGATFEAEKPGEYTVKLEGARPCGYHSIFIGGIRDPILISQLDKYIARVATAVKEQISFEYELRFLIYGQHGVMGSLEPISLSSQPPKEVGICGHAKTSTQAQADHVVNLARIYCVHAPYHHQLATAGNFAMPFSPCDISMGQVSEFCVYHIMQIANPIELFRNKLNTVKGSVQKASTEISVRIPPTTDKHVNGVNEILSDKDANRSTNRDTHCNTNGDHVVSSTTVVATPNIIVNGPMSVNNKTKAPSKYFLLPEPAYGSCYLGDLASVLRSKNAGPYELTFDIMFPDEDTYLKVRDCGVLNEATVARLYNIEEHDVVACLFWAPARAFKATIKRSAVSGGFGERDTHGSQQHVPFLYLVLPIPRL